ncbi:MAG: Uma2 family endonuclease [Elainellaceae cyanobacterium]
MTATPSPTQPYTAEAYLAQEVTADTRSEFRNGEIIPMTGGTPEHNKIITALNALLWFSLRREPYSLFMTDQRLWIPAVDIYTYPDAMVIADPVELKPGRKDTVINAILIAEVLSDSTQAYDRGGKFQAYRTMPSFQEYLLIDPNQPHIEQYVKQAENQWLLTESKGIEAQLALSSIPAAIALADLYDAVQ